MLFGCVAAFGLMVLAVALPIYMVVIGTMYKANCPYCGSCVQVGKPGTVRPCPRCQNTFVHRDGKLLKFTR